MLRLPIVRRQTVDQGISIGRLLGRIDENDGRSAGQVRLARSWLLLLLLLLLLLRLLLSDGEPAGHDGIALRRITAAEDGRATGDGTRGNQRNLQGRRCH